jgi:hypothetical protein
MKQHNKGRPSFEIPPRNVRQAQADFVAQCRRDSCLDHAMPLGTWPAPRPEVGPSALAYFEAKHRRGEFGRFYPVHSLCAWNSKVFRTSNGVD